MILPYLPFRGISQKSFHFCRFIIYERFKVVSQHFLKHFCITDFSAWTALETLERKLINSAYGTTLERLPIYNKTCWVNRYSAIIAMHPRRKSCPSTILFLVLFLTNFRCCRNVFKWLTTGMSRYHFSRPIPVIDISPGTVDDSQYLQITICKCLE